MDAHFSLMAPTTKFVTKNQQKKKLRLNQSLSVQTTKDSVRKTISESVTGTQTSQREHCF